MSVTGWVLTFTLFTFLFYLLHSHKKEREFTVTTATRAINSLTNAIQEANSKGDTNIFHAEGHVGNRTDVGGIHGDGNQNNIGKNDVGN